jgi:hypothetical protein
MGSPNSVIMLLMSSIRRKGGMLIFSGLSAGTTAEGSLKSLVM